MTFDLTAATRTLAAAALDPVHPAARRRCWPKPQPRAPGAGFVDPQGLPPRAARFSDIEPVYRGPSVDTLATVRKRGTPARGRGAGRADGHARQARRPGRLQRRPGTQAGGTDIGVNVEFVPTSWGYVIPDLLSRQFDVAITGLWVTVPRALVINFSQPTAEEGVYIVAHQRRCRHAAAAQRLQPHRRHHRGERRAPRRKPWCAACSRAPACWAWTTIRCRC